MTSSATPTARPQRVPSNTGAMTRRVTTVHSGWRQSTSNVIETTSEVNIEAGTVGAAMTRDVICIAPDVCLEDAARLMIERAIGALPVVDAEQRVLGLITRSDVMPALLQRVVAGSGARLDSFDVALMSAPRCETTAEIMKRGVLTLTPNEPLERAAELFAARKIHHAPVIAWNGALIGICTTLDLLAALAERANTGSDRSRT